MRDWPGHSQPGRGGQGLLRRFGHLFVPHGPMDDLSAFFMGAHGFDRASRRIGQLTSRMPQFCRGMVSALQL